MFIAVVGISAGPSFVQGLKEVGPMLFIIGALATSLPLLLGLILARYVFKFHPALSLGCTAGARTRSSRQRNTFLRIHRDLRRRKYTTHHMGSGHCIINQLKN